MSSDAEEIEAEASCTQFPSSTPVSVIYALMHDYIVTQTVACPMCSKTVLFKDVNEHIDSGCAKPVSRRAVAQTKESRNMTKDAWSNMLKGPASKSGAGSKGKGTG